MTWEFWFTIGIALILIGVVIWAFVGIKKKDNPVRLSNYLFAYRIVEDDTKALPTEFLANWKVSALENHLYLLDITLEDDLYLLDYLQNIWGFYDDCRVYIKAYKKDYGIYEIHHELLGEFRVEGGKVYQVK